MSDNVDADQIDRSGLSTPRTTMAGFGRPVLPPDAPLAGTPGISLRRLLFLLTAMLLLPALLLSVGMMWMQYQTDRTRGEAQLLEQAHDLARLVDREFARAEGGASTLAASEALAQGNLDAFDSEMRRTHDLLSQSLPVKETNKIAFFDADGIRRLYTVWPKGEHRVGKRGLPYVVRAIASGQSQNSDLITDPQAGSCPCLRSPGTSHGA